MITLHTEIDIAAPPHVVWEVLTDIQAYERWNPFIRRGEGTVAVGENLRMRMHPPGGVGANYTNVPTVVDENKTLEWTWKLMHTRLAGIRHRFDLEKTPTGTHFVHSEDFFGFLSWIASPFIRTRTLAAFEAMNQALKERAEAHEPQNK